MFTRFDDAGASLVEALVAIVVVLLVATPATSMLMKSMSGTRLQQQRQAAAAMADQTLEYARAVKPEHLPEGRSIAAVTTQIAAAPTLANFDMGHPLTLNGTTGTAVLPLVDTSQSIGGTAYLVRSFVARCWRPAGASSHCDAAVTAGSTEMYRITVAVTWRSAAGGCTLPDAQCEVLASTLVEPGTADPVFAP